MHTLKEASLSGVDALHDLKHNVSRSWFTSRHRILKKTDALGHYKFAPVRNLPDVPFSIRLRDDRFQSATISFLTSQTVTGAEQWEGASAIRSWEERGSINIPIFKWWRSVHDGHLGRIIDEEMDMYKHHTRRHLFGNENKGWLVTAYYSIAQQLASQDPVHYAMYTLLRPDHCTSLVSYPYYAKYSDFDARYPNTGAFEHIDHNIDNLMNSNSRVSSQIQGSISLDDETGNNCTKIAPGYHKPGALANWWKTVAEGERKSGAVTRIPPSAGLNWEPVPCKRGEARLTMPQIPHGAYPRYEGMERRRCVLTWLSKVDDNHTTLPNTERGAGTVGDLILSRVACTAPKTGPSGKFTLNANLPYRFPACVRLGSLGALSDVLLGFRHWDSPEFIAEQELLFHEDKSIALQFILDWRQNAYSIACESFRIIKDAEQHIFQTKSFWNSAGIEYPFESDSSNGEDEIKNKFT
ncbi:hypothetical protein EYC80_005313 [Monilinia laxa]|uniref:Uncharacterized protein n=1 Tax=Monilinia laxa TaxID=61186 RepID=A0A5N6KJU0_MONLA|nr:hypothetical protein EYC80_005313 [Monilinia laxa]